MKERVVPYIGTWIETGLALLKAGIGDVVPYIGTWIETLRYLACGEYGSSYLI